MNITGHLTRSVFDRYDIVSVSDLKIAVERMNARANRVTHTLTHTQPEPAPPRVPV
jgi:hypothetical protein